jgi:crotonobetainyl-CoA:carnitine CoA-transferase CaiB-like acyl-CoA transferase
MTGGEQGGEQGGKPLAGIRVLEVAMYGFVPSAGAVLADWGADVIKVEHAVTGDPQRGLRQIGAYKIGEGDRNPNIEHANRGKRSIGLQLGTPGGREVLYELARRADVFLTSFLPGHRRKFGIEVADIRAVSPQIIYARGSALGPRGAESDRGGYDMTAFWSRGTSAASLTPPNVEGLISPPPAYGDTISGTNLAGGIAAALLKRERTGEPSVVDVSLLGSGLWTMGHALSLSLHLKKPWTAPPQGSRGALSNPLSGLYRTADDRYISFVMLQPGKFWADVCQHIGRPELADDPRFATAELIAANAADGSAILAEAIATRTLPEWAERFATLAGPWAPVQDTLQAQGDAQVRANEYILPADGMELVSSPVQFDVTAPELRPAPEFAAQTEEILLELGLDWDRIIALKSAGAVT